MNSVPKGGWRSLVVVGAVVVCVAWVVAADDQASTSRTFYESLDVPLVSLEVVVSDRAGQPIRDLGPGDFEIFEDGRPVELTHFSFPPVVHDGGEELREGPLGIPEAPGRDVYMALYFDDLNISRRIRGSAVKQLRTFLSEPLPAAVRTTVVRFNGTLHVECEPTRDPAQIVAALDRVAKHTPTDITRDGELLVRSMEVDARETERIGRAVVFSEPDAQLRSDLRQFMQSDYLPLIHHYASQRFHRNRDSIEGLASFVGYLQGLEGRKVVLWAGSMETRSGENLFRTFQQLFPGRARAVGVNPVMDSMPYDVTGELRNLVQYASSHRVSFYPIGALAGITPVTFEFDNRILEGGGPPGSTGPVDTRAIANALEVMAVNTGGRTLNVGGLDDELIQVAGDLGSAYSLAYRPTDFGDRKYHKIVVKVNREGAVVRHRHGYRFDSDANDLEARTVSAALLGITENPLGINVSARRQETRDDGLYMVPVAVEIPIGNLVLSAEAERHVARISVVSVVKDDKGRLSDVHEREYPVTISNDQLIASVDQHATVVLGMILRRGPHRISVSVRDNISSIVATRFVDVVVGTETGGAAG